MITTRNNDKDLNPCINIENQVTAYNEAEWAGLLHNLNYLYANMVENSITTEASIQQIVVILLCSMAMKYSHMSYYLKDFGQSSKCHKQDRKPQWDHQGVHDEYIYLPKKKEVQNGQYRQMKEMGKSFAFAPTKAILARCTLASIFMFFAVDWAYMGRKIGNGSGEEGAGRWGRAEE